MTKPADSETPTESSATDAGSGAPADAAKASSAQAKPSDKSGTPKRKPAQIKAAAKMLRKEARSIIKKYEGRLGPQLTEDLRERAVKLDRLLGEKNWGPLEVECEGIDELLHQKASFARKGAIRETLENVSIAVLVALGLRSCLYEPYKIPSPSMVPTLIPGDHIFVNKFRYGIQIPFTTTVVGEDLVSGIQRGEVVVFRYPLDETDDYIKRVIGIPGDTIRVEGDAVAIKRAGDSDFEYLKRTRLEQPCPDNYDPTKTVENCSLFEESIDEHTYVIRIDRNGPSPTRGRTRTITVPEGGVLVMGDNRRDSEDSLQWAVRKPAVFAEGVITPKDLRDLTVERIFESTNEEAFEAMPELDAVSYVAERSAARYDISLELWRDPSLGVDALYQAASQGAKAGELTVLLDAEPGMTGPGAQKRIRAVAPRVDKLAWRSDEHSREAVFVVAAADAGTSVVAHIRCGLEQCPTSGELARQVSRVVETIEIDATRPAREMLARPSGYRFIPKWSGRDENEGRFLDRSFRQSEKHTSDAQLVRVQAWREAGEGGALVLQAANLAMGTASEAQRELPYGNARIAPSESEGSKTGFNIVGQVDDHAVVFAVNCGLKRCKNLKAAQDFARELAEAAHSGAQTATKLDEIASRSLIGERWTVAPDLTPESYAWDSVELHARVRDQAYALKVRVEQPDKAGLADALADKRSEYQGAQDDPNTGGFKATTPAGQIRSFVSSETNAMVELICTPALCDASVADGLATRAQDKLRDASNFVDPEHRVEQPFVPRGNVKGRAERIWRPMDRFWNKID